MPRINKTFVDRVAIPVPATTGVAVQDFHRDDLLKGFALRVTSGGAKSFIVEKRIKGKVRRQTLGRYPALVPEKARQQAQEFLGEVAGGGDPITARSVDKLERAALQEVLDDYLRTHPNLKPRTIKDYRYAIEVGLQHWLKKPLIDISKDMVEAQHAKHGERSRARANNTMRVLRALFNFAMIQYEDANGSPLILVNPVSRLSNNRTWYRIDRKQTMIKPHELRAWYEATLQLNRESTRDYLHFLLFTGLRRSEAAQLQWNQVDLIDRSFRIEDTKNGEPHTLPLSEYLFDLLNKRNVANIDQCPWVFPSPLNDGPLKDPRTAVARVAGLSNVPFTLHDLRRTFITIAESLDIPAYALKRLLNHKDSNDVTAGYIVSSVDRLREPMQRISSFILESIDA